MKLLEASFPKRCSPSCHQSQTVRFISRPTGDRAGKLVCSTSKGLKRTRLTTRDVFLCPGVGFVVSKYERASHVCKAREGSGSLENATGMIRAAAKVVIQFCSDVYRMVLSNGPARVTAAFTLFLAVTTALLNTCFTGYMHKRVLPAVNTEVATLLEREVDIGKVHWISPIGLIGCTPLASVGPVSVGPGPVEKTSAMVPTVRAGINVLQSIMRGQIVLWLNCHTPEVDLVQAGNFSWFGHPQDTTPSSKDYLPGLTKRNARAAAAKNMPTSGKNPMQFSEDWRHIEESDQQFTELALQERRSSHYGSSTSSTASGPSLQRYGKKAPERVGKLQRLHKAQGAHRLSWEFCNQNLRKDAHGADVVRDETALGSLRNRSLMIGMPGWWVAGPDGSISMVSSNLGNVVYNSMDSETPPDGNVDSGPEASSPSVPPEQKNPRGPPGKRRYRIRVKKETSHSRPSVSPEALKDGKGREHVKESASGSNLQSPSKTMVGGKDSQESATVNGSSIGVVNDDPLGDLPSSTQTKGSHQDNISPKPASQLAPVDSVAEAGAKPAKQSPSTKSVEVEVVLPAGDMDLPSGVSKRSTSPNLPSSGNVTREEVSQWVAAGWRQLTRHIRSPEVAVGKIAVQKGLLYAHMAGEVIPREVTDVNGHISFASGYHALSVDVKGKPHVRNLLSIKSTMLSPSGPRHLRFVTPGIEGGYDHVFPGDITKDSIQQQRRPVSEFQTEDLSITSSLSKLSRDALAQNADESDIGKGEEGGKRGRYSSLCMAPAFQGLLWDVDGMGSSVKGSPKSEKVPTPSPARKLGKRQPTQGRPKGGNLHVTVEAHDMLKEGVWPKLEAKVYGRHLHGPLIDRILEIPIDIHDGRANGYVQIRAFNSQTWEFPKIDGKILCKNVDFHFWDAPDHLSKCNFDLIIEDNHMYFHNATGQYGSVPLYVTGDMDLDPEIGHYRLTATVPPVEVNAIRAALGVRPLPHPMSGSVSGTLHCTGPLEEPVFSGSGQVIRPTEAAIEALEDSHAKATLQANSQAVAAFDKVAFTSGSAVFTHDTATDIFTLHDAVAMPVGGGKLTGSGKMWVAPMAEEDPQAIAMRIEGYGINAKEVIKSYLPETVEPPEVLDPGATNVKASMRGSHASPRMDIRWEAPSVNASGSAELSRKYWKATAQAPTFDVSGTLHTKFPDFELTKTAYAQAEMNALTTPSIVGVDTDITTKGCDVMPLVSNTSAVDRVASGQAVRLKLSGRTQISARRLEDGTDPSNAVFSGDISLQGLRVNQLNLAKQLGGSLDFSPTGLKLLARGQRADELLDIDFALPRDMWTEDGLGFGKSPSLVSEKEVSDEENKVLEGQENVAEEDGKGGYFSLRQGKLLISTEISSLLSRVKMIIRGLKLDDLELASLRGNLQDVSLDLNFGSREGRGEINMRNPRYSGLMGEYLAGGFRWEKDVVRLERTILQQQRSRYEVEGEYSLPANLSLPRSFPELTHGAPVVSDSPWVSGKSNGANGTQQIGRWRVQVTVPNADVEEIIPAGRLLSRATSLTQRNYDEAKTTFLDGLTSAGISSGKLGEELKKIIMPEVDNPKDSSEGSTNGTPLPGLQTLRGKWEGTLQAWGGGEGASMLNVKARGDSWQWGEYELDKAVAIGSYHSSEGIHVQELSLGTGEAQLLIRGDLLGPKQDATIVLNDFPAALLSPIYRAVPALQNAVPAVSERVSLNRFLDSWESTFKSVGLNFWKEDTPMQRLAKGSPVNGLLYVRGTLGGSAERPEGVVNVQLYDGALGPTRLANAKAEVTLNEQQEIQIDLSASPDETSGYVKVAGTLPFLQENGIRGNMDANVKVVDGGMMLVSALLPDFRWEAGTADINVSANGPITDPEIKGSANVARATMYSPNLKYPLKNVHGHMTIDSGKISVENFEAKSGNHGHVHARGSLPIEMSSPRDVGGLFSVDLSGLELRVNNAYNGRLDSSVLVTKSLKEPVVSGAIELSKGTLQLQFGALGSSEDKNSGNAVLGHSGAFGAEGQILGLGPGASMMYQPPELVETPLKGVQLQNLELILGSELRFQVPLMVNLAISGSVEVSGGLDPGSLVPNGTIQIDGGMVNLLATQLKMARADQPGRIMFIPDQGLDPNVDITFTSATEGFQTICKGRASTWQENIIVADGTDEVRLSQAAKMFQKRLDEVLVAENGQLAFVNLAASTMATMTPRLDTQGQIGAARWRLVSAPNIPDLLTNADRLDLQNIVTSLITGTEVEVQFGPTVQAIVTHKMRGTDYGTQWNLSLNLTENFRLSATVANSPPTTRTIMLEYRSGGRPRLL